MKHRVVSAATESSNNAQTDLMPKVWHHVVVILTYSAATDGRDGDETIKVRHYSADPLQAIREVDKMDTAAVAKMRRVAGNEQDIY
jgi:hypothetical protein